MKVMAALLNVVHVSMLILEIYHAFTVKTSRTPLGFKSLLMV